MTVWLTKLKKGLAFFGKSRVPCFSYCLAAAALSAVLLFVSSESAALADILNATWGNAVRAVMAYLTLLLPFSFAEFLLFASPVLLLYVIFHLVYSIRRGIVSSIRFLSFLCSVLCILYTLYVPGLGIGYHTTPLSEKLGLEDAEVSAEQLAETMDWLISETNALCGDVDFAFADASEMPFASYREMCADIIVGYRRLRQDYPLYWDFTTWIKPVILSEAMSYTHLTGIYTFFTGEANLNVAFPDYTLPFTAAHELAHQRGFAKEKEANMMAFLVCIHADSAYTRYSGYLNMVEYFSNALYSADKDLWREEMAKLDSRVQYELEAYSRFFEKYRESKAAEVTDTINDTYLKSRGQDAGTKSYGLVVDLTVAYYEAVITKQ